MKKLLFIPLVLILSTSAFAQTTYLMGSYTPTPRATWITNQGEIWHQKRPTNCGLLCESIGYREFRTPSPGTWYLRIGAGYIQGQCADPAKPISLFYQRSEHTNNNPISVGCVALNTTVKVRMTRSAGLPDDSKNWTKMQWMLNGALIPTYSRDLPTTLSINALLQCRGNLKVFRPVGKPLPVPVRASSTNNICNGQPEIGPLWVSSGNPYGPFVTDTVANYNEQKY